MALALIMMLAGCSDEPEQPDRRDPSENRAQVSRVFMVDPTVSPLQAEIAGINGGPTRSVSRIVDRRGADFVDGELLVETSDPVELAAIIRRWDGRLLFTIDGGGSATDLHLIAIDSKLADPARLDEFLSAEHLSGLRRHRISSESGLRTLAAAAIETNVYGNDAAANFISHSLEFAARSAIEAPTATGPSAGLYTPQAYDWPYINRGSAQDIGVGDAWRMLDSAGLLSNKVDIFVADGGFVPNDDLPDDVSILPAGSWNTPNPATCTGGTPCEWHGTHVAMIAMGKVDNFFGTAGPAGPVARATLIQAPSQDLASIFRWATIALRQALIGGDRVLNMSGGTSIAAGACLIGACAALDGLSALLRARGYLLIAAAGNEGENVDRRDCFFFTCWEEELWAPCELDGVMCVGGIRWDSTAWHNGSNYSGDHGDCCTVDLMAPFDVWSKDNPLLVDNVNSLYSGTSFSAPFVSGVAGLVWAADPSLTDGEVEDILMRTAHTQPSRFAPRWVNAYEAVREALGGDAPPLVNIIAPADHGRYSVGKRVPLEAFVEDDGPLTALNISWESDLDGPIGTASSTTATFALREGHHTITVTVSDATWTIQDSVEIDVENDPPSVTILSPGHGDTFYQANPIHFVATSFDPNLGGPLPQANITWYRNGAATPFGYTHNASIPGGTLSTGTHAIEVRGTDGSLTDTRSINVVVVENPDDVPPAAVIVSPSYGASFLADQFDSTSGKYYANVTLCGYGDDAEDGTFHGPSGVTWYGRLKGAGVYQILAAGTGPGTCPNVRLYVENPGAMNEYEVRLRVEDSAGQVGTADIEISVYDFF